MKTSCPASLRLAPERAFYEFFEIDFWEKKQWVEFDTLYSTRRLERLRIFMAENNVPYKVRAALLLVPLNTPIPTGAVTQSLWYIAVRSGDVPGCSTIFVQKGIPKMEQLSARLLLTADILLLIAGGIFAILQGWLYTGLLWAGAFGCLMAALNFRDSKNDGG